LFGIQSYTIARRTPEIGVRIALGAAPSGVLVSVVRDGLRLVMYGTLVGLPLVAVGAWSAARRITEPAPRAILVASIGFVPLSCFGVKSGGYLFPVVPAWAAGRTYTATPCTSRRKSSSTLRSGPASPTGLTKSGLVILLKKTGLIGTGLVKLGLVKTVLAKRDASRAATA